MTGRRRAGAAICLSLLAAAGGVAWASVRSDGAAAGGLRGDAVWASGSRPAPAFALTDQSGHRVSPASLRGRPWMLMFLDSHCRTLCPIAGRQVAQAERLLGSRRVRLVVVSVDPGDSAASVAHAARRWGWHGDWSWLMGSAAELRPVWRAYDIGVQPTPTDISHTIAVYLIDGAGDERAGFLPPIAVGALVRDARVLQGASAGA